MAKFMHGWVNQQILICGTKIIYGWGGQRKGASSSPYKFLEKSQGIYRNCETRSSKVKDHIVPNESPNMISS